MAPFCNADASYVEAHDPEAHRLVMPLAKTAVVALRGQLIPARAEASLDQKLSYLAGLGAPDRDTVYMHVYVRGAGWDDGYSVGKLFVIRLREGRRTITFKVGTELEKGGGGAKVRRPLHAAAV